MTTHRQRIEAALGGEVLDRPPAALWRHFPQDDLTGEGLARATLAYQERFGWDFVKVSPPSEYCVHDWGSRGVYEGSFEGTRRYTAWAVVEPEDWDRLEPLDPRRGSLGEAVEAVRRLRAALGPDVPVLLTVFAPSAVAKYLAGPDRFPIHLRREPDRVLGALKRAVVPTTQALIEGALAAGADGIFLALQHADYSAFSPAEYREGFVPLDLAVLEAAQGGWFNLLHIHGPAPLFDLVADYPVQALNWHDRTAGPSLAAARERTDKLLVGGLARWETLVRGDRAAVLEQARDALAQVGGRGLVLGPDCVVPLVAPEGNQAAVREAVEGWTG